MNVKRFLTACLTVGVISVAVAYSESNESGNKQISKAENVGEIGFGDPVCISGICTSQEDRDYYKIVPLGTVLGCLSTRESLAGSRISIWLLDSSGTPVEHLLSEYDREKNVEVSVSVGSTYYIYAQGTGPRYSFYNEKYEIWLACDGGGNPPADKTMTSLSISGASSVTGGSGGSYACTAYYSDGSSSTVSPTWSIESGTSYASVNSSGWLTAYTVTAPQSVTLKASYGGKSTTKPITVNPKEDDNVMVTFNGNGGTVYNLAGQAVGPSIQLAQTPGTTWRNLPGATNGSKTFDGWWTQPSGGTRISISDTFFGTPTTVYAHWKTPVTPTLSLSPTSGDDVDWGGGAGWFSVTCNSSWSVSTSDAWITLNTRSGSNSGTVYFTYDDNDSSSLRLGKITVACGSLTRTYQFIQLQRKVRIVWDANGGEIPGVDDPVTEMTLGTTFEYPYSAISYDGAFVGWYTSRIGGIKVTSTTTVRDVLDEDSPDEVVLYAHWRPWGAPSGLEYFACDEWRCDLGARDLPFIAAGTHVVYGDGVDEILFVPSTSGWQTIWLHSKATSSASGYLLDRSGYLLVRLHDEQGGLGSLCECQKMSVYLTAGKPYSLTFAEERYNSTRPTAGETFAFELQVGGSAPQIAYLDAPAIVSVSSSEIRWSAVSGATEYSVYRYPQAWAIKSGSSKYGDCIATVSAAGGTCCRITTNPGDVFYVRAVNSKATSWFSDGYEYNPPTYEIQFKDGGDSSPMKTGSLSVIRQLMSSCACEIGKVYALPACSFRPPVGKIRFAGWTCSKNGRRYDDGMLIFNLAEPGETVTMTAIWE